MFIQSLAIGSSGFFAFLKFNLNQKKLSGVFPINKSIKFLVMIPTNQISWVFFKMLKLDQNRNLYLNLLKKSLTNFFHIACEYSHYANAMPLEWVLPEPENKDLPLTQLLILKAKVFCKALLIGAFGKFGLLITRSDGLTDSQR